MKKINNPLSVVDDELKILNVLEDRPKKDVFKFSDMKKAFEAGKKYGMSEYQRIHDYMLGDPSSKTPELNFNEWMKSKYK